MKRQWIEEWKLGALSVVMASAGVAIVSGVLYQGACGGTETAQSAAKLGPIETAIKSGDLAPLSRVAVPMPVGGDVVDHTAAVRLGKALFWDAQVGSDGMTSCATCHFNAGADSRHMNAVNPGPDGIFQTVSGPGQMFLMTALTSDDRVGSEGVFGGIFRALGTPPSAVDQCDPDPQMPFMMENRRVTGRQAPSAIGAVFNRQNFWDGRANHVFNGQNPFGGTGNAAPPANILADSQGGGGDLGSGRGGPPPTSIANASVASAAVEAANASLSSQAVGPPLSGTEMSCSGRQFNGPNSLASKMLALKPLALQMVSQTDSALGSLSAAPMKGLRCGTSSCTYTQLISAAFGAAMAAQAEAKFSSIFGQAIQAYESTLIPDKTPLDKYLSGNSSALTAHQLRGLDRFTGKAGCIHCHAGPELTDASLTFAAQAGLVNEDGGDQGFHNLGVRPTVEDLGRAGTGPQGVPFAENGSPMNRGAFKTAQLRNVGLTAPYFHNGAKPTLAMVVDFYNRGGDFANPEQAKRIQPLSLDADDQGALVDFLENGLTDCRVAMNAAPFDHPSLTVTHGPDMPAVGRAGTGPCK